MAAASPIAAARVQRLATAGLDFNKASLRGMPEGDSLAKTARRLQVLVGEQVEVQTPHPRAAVKELARRLDGRRLLGVEAAGKIGSDRNVGAQLQSHRIGEQRAQTMERWSVTPLSATAA